MITRAECGKVLIVEMVRYYTANRRFLLFVMLTVPHAWHLIHETNGDKK